MSLSCKKISNLKDFNIKSTKVQGNLRWEKNSEIKKNFHCWVYARSRLVSTEAKTFSSLCLLLLVVPGLHSYACPLHCKIEEYILQQHEVGVLASILR